MKLRRLTSLALGLICLWLCQSYAMAQEVLLPLAQQRVSLSSLQSRQSKSSNDPITLPFFDDFAGEQGAASAKLWDSRGVYVNQGYAMLPPTVGMATLDALDSNGQLYAQASSSPFPGDTLLSRPLRLDSIFEPYARELSPADSIYLSFFYVPGGGGGPMWERCGDTPDPGDSLILEFYDPIADAWTSIWSTPGVCVDTLVARTGTAWQYVSLPIRETQYFSAQFRFRFRNICSLNSNSKPGMSGNQDQWNLDYIVVNQGRQESVRTFRDVAFVTPAPSLLRNYQAMPIRQYMASCMADSLSVTITNLYSQELASSYGYTIFDESGTELYSYDGGYENAPAYWPTMEYQQSQSHAAPRVEYAFPTGTDSRRFTIVHVVREGVSGDACPANDTIVFHQVLDNYYAYDDGTAENGYGITSTSSKVFLAVRFDMPVDDTLTAVDIFFNSTFNDENSRVPFYLTIWDDVEGHPGNIIYRDTQRRRAQAANQSNGFTRYALEEAVCLGGRIYVGLEQATSDYINIGFDRNIDTRDNIYYRSDANWQTTILKGSLMLRPNYGAKALVDIAHVDSNNSVQVWAEGRQIHVRLNSPSHVRVLDLLGRTVAQTRIAEIGTVPVEHSGVYLVAVDGQPAQKVLIR